MWEHFILLFLLESPTNLTWAFFFRIESENNLLKTQFQALDEQTLYSDYETNTDFFWIGGDGGDGWLSGDDYDYTCGTECFSSTFITLNSDGVTWALSLSSANLELAWSSVEKNWHFKSDASNYGKICEFVLDGNMFSDKECTCAASGA